MPPPRFQYSLAALLLTVAVVAGDLALILHAESVVAMLASVGLMLIFMGFIAIELLYGRDNVRPFCIGAAFPLTIAFLNVSFSANFLLDDIAEMLG